MKRVSFEVAKYLKEIGYPQENIGQGMVYNTHEHLVEVYGMCASFVAAPTYLDVWLWLWREKDIQIAPCKGLALTKINDQWENLIPRELWEDYTDPEEGIIAAIEYLVTNNLIK